MTDDEVKQLIQKSVIRTSDKFTDELMRKVELQSKAEKKIKIHFLIACLACVFGFLFIFKLSLDINLLFIQLNPSPVIIRVLGSLFVFIMLNRLITLRNNLLKIR
jgi:hypothetical protein